MTFADTFNRRVNLSTKIRIPLRCIQPADHKLTAKYRKFVRDNAGFYKGTRLPEEDVVGRQLRKKNMLCSTIPRGHARVGVL